MAMTARPRRGGATTIAAAAAAALLLACSPSPVASQATCPNALTPSYASPVLGAGWTAQLVARGLSDPRGIVLDSSGGLLVVEQGRGIRRITFKEDGNGACFGVDKNQTVVDLKELNHGIELSDDGKTLYASSADSVYSWEYDVGQGAAKADSRRTLISGMASQGHTSRTILMSRKTKGTLLVSRGSASNMDADARDRGSGVSQIRAFDLSSPPTDGGRARAFRYASEGRLVGWGLRNSVGVAEHPGAAGGVYSVENSADDVRRMGADVHRDNPGEEMNFHGPVSSPAGANHGYPDCLALWDTNVPQGSGMRTGAQFALGGEGSNVTDAACAGSNFAAPRLTFQAHTAPLDLKFSADGAEAYVSFHGSWNRDDPVGYKISMIRFANGEPTEPADSRSSTVDIMSNPDLSACPGRCFRPVGLALDQRGRMFMSSDSTGEIYLLRKSEMAATDTGKAGGNNGGASSAGHLVMPSLLGSVCLMLLFLHAGSRW
ncbi:hypothetical protein RB597_003300 [Gaeumannomyces tritici]